MLARLPILAGLATLAAADFHIYWEAGGTSSASLDAAYFGGVKFFPDTPACANFKNGKELALSAMRDVSNSQGGGYMCDGCDPTVSKNDWRPTRVQLNDYHHKVFTAPPYYITLYRTEGLSYTVKDTNDVVVGNCTLVVDGRQTCGSGKDPEGLEAFQCTTPNINV